MSVRGVGFPLGVFLLLALVAAGCQSHTVDPTTNQKTRQPFETVVVGDITPLYPEWKRLARFYKAALAQKLTELEAFDTVLYPAPVNLPPDAIVVEGVIDGVDEGSEFMRMLIVGNASRAVVQGRFRLVDGSDRVLAEFRQERVSDGSSFHDEQIYMEDLVGRFGRDTAGVVIRWSRGNDLEADWRAVEWWDEARGHFD